jgi:hypothetical protein
MAESKTAQVVRKDMEFSSMHTWLSAWLLLAFRIF